jgi:hypothetical protein
MILKGLGFRILLPSQLEKGETHALQIALWTGLVMGGGAGLTVPGIGIATEKM